MQKVRIRYAKRGRLRFTSHRDVSRAIERAVVRARIPMAYSSGFHPHPRISYAGASPTGAASEAEYVELALAEVRDPGAIGADLDASLPEGLDVVAAVDAAASVVGSLADLLTGSRWLIELGDTPRERIESAVDAFLAAESLTVERMTKKGMRSFDCRAPVVRLSVGEGSALDLLLRHTVPAVRPDDVLNGLREVGSLEPAGPALLTRLGQGVLDVDAGALTDPLAPR